MNEINSPTPELIQQATDLVVRLNAVSVSLFQRQFRIGYSEGMGLVQALEGRGMITPPGTDGYRMLTAQAYSLRQERNQPTARNLFEAWAGDPFEGGDGGDVGSQMSPSIWLFGMEHGDAVNIEQEPELDRGERDYSIDKQLIYPFNRNAFKLLAAIHGEPVERYDQFARLHQPWVPGAKGYFKGNLYPYPCRNIDTWSEQAVKETGFERKDDLVKWCNDNRIPAIADAVRQFRPKLFIGIGSTMASQFSLAYFGANVPLESHQFAINGYTKKILYATHNGGRLVVLPHITGGPNGINSDAAFQIAGSFIAGLMQN